LDADRFRAFSLPAEQRTPAQQAAVEYSDRLIDELRRADALVLGLPLYNFGVPSTLKAYFDHVARAGITFRYTAQGSVGLLTGKRAVVFATRGGIYEGADTQPQYIRNFLGFLGIEAIEFVFAEGLALGEASKQRAIAQAQAEIRRAAAVALEQEMKARVQEMQAKVVQAQAEVPLAMAEAFRKGNLGVMDYFRMENVQSDTGMRKSIANPDDSK
jgi:FMN-dependent NADH-azoreductase